MKQSRLDASYRNAKQRAEIVLARSSFRESVKAFRKKWKIDSDGLSKKRFADWQISFVHQRNQYIPDEEDIELEKQRQKRINASSQQLIQGFDRLIEKYPDLSSLDGMRVYKNDIGSILINEWLGPRWYRYVEHFLIFNKKIRVPSGIEFQTSIDENSGQEIILLRITDEIRKPDLVETWASVKIYQEKLPYYGKSTIQPMSAFARNEKVAEMKRKDKSTQEILDFLEENYPKKDSDVYMPTDISKMLSEYNKSLEK